MKTSKASAGRSLQQCAPLVISNDVTDLEVFLAGLLLVSLKQEFHSIDILLINGV